MENDNFDAMGSSIPPRRRQKSVWPWIAAAIIFALAALAGALFASDTLLSKKHPPKKTATVAVKQEEEKLITAKDKAIIMLMGVDERADDVGRSDTLMIAAVDPKKNKVSLLSVPRDTRVRLKNHGYDKINAAYAYGGEEMTKDTVEDFLGVHIDHYIIVNVQSFVKIIDAIGGVDINVESRMYYEDPWDDNGGLYIDLYPGLQHMDGKTAVTYVRFRDEEGDIGRIKRQQKFMQACMDKVTSPSIILKIPAVAKEVFSSLRTDLTIRQLVEFAGTLREAKAKGLSADMVPGRPLYIDGISYWIPDISKMRHTVADTLDVEVSRAMRSDFERDAREYEESIPDSATSVPETDHSIGRVSSYAPRRHRAPSYTEEKAEEPPKNTAPTLESEEAKILPPAEVSEPEKTPPASSPNASRYEEPNPPTQSPRSERLREPTSEESDAPSPSPNSGRKEL